jgi:hypothetical protein
VFAFCAAVFSQAVIAPCYEPIAASRYLRETPKGKEGRVWLLMNVNSGPLWHSGNMRLRTDPTYTRLIMQAMERGHPWVAYIDVMAGPGYSPVLRDGIVHTPASKRLKTVQELRAERDAWMSYGPCSAYFVDDIAPGHVALFGELNSWRSSNVKIIHNPGTAWALPNIFRKDLVVISETSGAWPRTLTSWERVNVSRCVVMGLKIPQKSLPAFMSSTAGMALRYASPLDDDDGAYNQATPYLRELLGP